MKSLLSCLLAGIICMSSVHATAPVEAIPVASTASAPRSKTVCIDVLDNKTNKKIKKCRVMKMHKKYQGTVIPASKK